MTTDHGRDGGDSDLLALWLMRRDVEVGKLQAADGPALPDGFLFDYSPASLPVLEDAALAYQAQTAAEGHGSQIAFYTLALAAYLGETILHTAGGHWDWEGSEEDGTPLVLVDPVLKAGPVRLRDIVERALTEATGGVFAEEHGWMQIAADAQHQSDPAWRPIQTEGGTHQAGPQR
ncbi:hypothetical protein [Streptomyces sp. HUAS TT7]|uniref:hypothetical protein n=1 Tax=Streptomyces sp. HUAS TT7 TaxID=3447507 RepID=UPI003F6559E8